MKQKWKNLTHLEDCTNITDLKAVIVTKKYLNPTNGSENMRNVIHKA